MKFSKWNNCSVCCRSVVTCVLILPFLARSLHAAAMSSAEHLLPHEQEDLVKHCAEMIKHVDELLDVTSSNREVWLSDSTVELNTEQRYPLLVVRWNGTHTCAVDTNHWIRKVEVKYKSALAVPEKRPVDTAEWIKSKLFGDYLSMSKPICSPVGSKTFCITWNKIANGIRISDQFIRIGFTESNRISYVRNTVEFPLDPANISARVPLKAMPLCLFC